MAEGARLHPHAVRQVDGVQHFGQVVALARVELEEHRGFDALGGFQSQLEVFKHAQVLEDRRLLELTADAQLSDLGLVVAQQVDGAAKEHAAFVWAGFAGDDVHHRGLARAVGADDAAQLTGRNVERQLVDGLEAIKAHAHVFQIQDAAMRHIHLAGVLDHAAIACAAATGLCVFNALLGHAGHAFSAFLQQIGRHAAPPFLGARSCA